MQITLKQMLIIFFFNDTATTEIYTLSLHDALPISLTDVQVLLGHLRPDTLPALFGRDGRSRSEEHTSELQSQSNLVCRLLLEKKKNKNVNAHMFPKSPTKSTYNRINSPHSLTSIQV